MADLLQLTAGPDVCCTIGMPAAPRLLRGLTAHIAALRVSRLVRRQHVDAKLEGPAVAPSYPLLPALPRPPLQPGPISRSARSTTAAREESPPGRACDVCD